MNRADKTSRLRALASANKFYWTDEEENEYSLLQNEALQNIKDVGYYSITDRIALCVTGCSWSSDGTIW